MIQTTLSLLLMLPQATPQQTADAILEEFRKEHKIVGMTAAVFSGNKLVYAGQVGYADQEAQKPATANTWFRLGSISKPVTAVGIMRLVDQGKMSIDEDCVKYIPEWPMDFPKATVRNFLTHTSGIRHYKPVGDPDGKKFYPTAQSALNIFLHDPLMFNPGKMFAYSTHGYTLAARATETVTGMPFQDWLRKDIFPFAKGGLDVEILTEKKDRAALYAPKAGVNEPQTPREDNSWKFAGGGMEATATGLGQFLNELLHVQIVGNDSMRQLFSSMKLTDGSFSNYGLGFRLEKGGLVGHNGAQQGCRTGMLMDLKRQTVAVVLTNTEGSFDPGDIAEKLLTMAPSFK